MPWATNKRKGDKTMSSCFFHHQELDLIDHYKEIFIGKKLCKENGVKYKEKNGLVFTYPTE